MKTKTTTLMMVTMLAWSVMSANAEEQKLSWFRRTFGTLTWDEIQTQVKTPEMICAAVRHHVYYVKDLKQVWATGKQTWDKKTGDCKDFASCVVDLCQAAGIKTTTQVFYRKGSWDWVGHAVVIGTLDDRLWISSNGGYRTVKSMAEAKEVIARELQWGAGKDVQVASSEEVRSGSLAIASPTR